MMFSAEELAKRYLLIRRLVHSATLAMLEEPESNSEAVAAACGALLVEAILRHSPDRAARLRHFEHEILHARDWIERTPDGKMTPVGELSGPCLVHWRIRNWPQSS